MTLDQLLIHKHLLEKVIKEKPALLKKHKRLTKKIKKIRKNAEVFVQTCTFTTKYFFITKTYTPKLRSFTFELTHKTEDTLPLHKVMEINNHLVEYQAASDKLKREQYYIDKKLSFIDILEGILAKTNCPLIDNKDTEVADYVIDRLCNYSKDFK